MQYLRPVHIWGVDVAVDAVKLDVGGEHSGRT